MTKKQKEDQRLADLRKQALLASGVQVEGLQAPGGGSSGKKVVYTNRKKDNKKPVVADSKNASPAPSLPATPVAASNALPDPEATRQEEKDEWDESSEDEAPAAAEVKDEWDVSSEEEEPSKPTAATSTKGILFLFGANRFDTDQLFSLQVRESYVCKSRQRYTCFDHT